MRDSSWIFPDGADRERMLELDRQLQPVRRAAFLVLGLSLVACGPWLGWWTLLPFLLSLAGFRVADARMGSVRHPEYALLGAWLASEVITALAVALSGGASVPTTAWLAIPVLTLGARFSNRGIAIGVGSALALLLAVELGTDTHAVVADPPLLIAPAALIVCVALFQTVLMRSEIRLRGEVAVDSLTGLLNRRALTGRVAELEQQSQITRQPVALVVADIDHFKSFNDTYGHAAGDALLRDISYRLRKRLRAFDLCYRIGGEEFVVLLPGAALAQAAEVADHLRESVEAFESSGRSVTMSFGVAASQDGEPFDYAAVYGEADAALYEAKRTGRNRVCLSGGAVPLPARASLSPLEGEPAPQPAA